MKSILKQILQFWAVYYLILLGAVPYFFPADSRLEIATKFNSLMIYSLLALALHVIVGYTGILHLGIAGYFGIGAYMTGILCTPIFPFEFCFLYLIVIAIVTAAIAAVVFTAPMLRLRGDYLALVTLGFGQIIIFVIQNMESITAGTQSLSPVDPALVPKWSYPLFKSLGFSETWLNYDWKIFPNFYLLTLLMLMLVYWLLHNLEQSALGRALVALREEELAASCMGLSPVKLKLIALALAGAISGLAGCLYVTSISSTAGPKDYGFNRSILMLCCLILGGLGNRRGLLVGAFILVGYDTILADILNTQIQQTTWSTKVKNLLQPSNWKFALFGGVLILIMRYRPEGLFPAQRKSRAVKTPLESASQSTVSPQGSVSIAPSNSPLDSNSAKQEN